MTARLGLEPDEVMVRGSRTADPPRPVSHAWTLICDTPGVQAGDQVAHILDRLAPHATALEALTTELHRTSTGSAILQIVRYFDTDEHDALGTVRQKSLADSHQLLGWHLDADVIAFVHRTRAAIDVDEYP